MKIKKERQGILIPNKVLREAGVKKEQLEVEIHKQLIVIKPSFTKLTKGLVKNPKIDPDSLHEDYERELFSRGLGRD